MNDTNQFIYQQSARTQYEHSMLRMAEDELDPFQYRLLGHYISAGGDGNDVSEGITTTAEKCRMSVPTVRKVRQELVGLGYIQLQEFSDEEYRNGQSVIVTVIDRTLENAQRYSPPAMQNIATPMQNIATGGMQNIARKELETIQEKEREKDKYIATADAAAPRVTTTHQRMYQSLCDVMGVSVADVAASNQNGDYGRVASTLVKANFSTAEVPALRAYTLKMARDNGWTQKPTVNALSKYFPNYRASLNPTVPSTPSRYNQPPTPGLYRQKVQS